MATSVESNAATLVESASGFERWRTPRSEMKLWWSDRGIRIVVHGTADAGLARPIVAACEHRLRSTAALTSCFDFANAPNYDSALRTELTSWASKRRAQLAAIHVYTESKLVRMGATVANLALGHLIRIHAERDTFDVVLRGIGLGACASDLGGAATA